ncbi:MAG: ATP phosphoribosyltransferase regulatory subunit [Desulfuromonadia bacterium]
MFDPVRTDISLPAGVADFLPRQATEISRLESTITRLFELWGFQRIIPPLLEYQDVISIGVGDELRDKMFRFDDRLGNRLLALPPDITPQIARIAATRLSSHPLPHRFWYLGRILRQSEKGSGRGREFRQAGVELIGLDSPEADAEMIAMAAEALSRLGFPRFTIDLCHVDFTRSILDDAPFPPTLRHRVEQALRRKDISHLTELVKDTPLSPELQRAVCALPRLFGGREVIDRAREFSPSPRADKALDTLSQVIDIVDLYGIGDVLTIDLGEMRGFNYHTGVTFEGFVEGCAEPVCSGGRYDTLLERYGMAAPATGFAFNILSLLNAWDDGTTRHHEAGRDILLFNRNRDRTTVIALARRLRSRGYSVARDIIPRDLDQSVRYARTMNIRAVVVTDDESDPPLTIIDSRTGEEHRVHEEGLPDVLSLLLESTRRRDNG